MDDAGTPCRPEPVGPLTAWCWRADAGRRNPAVTAQAAATLHLLTRGRAILGMGAGNGKPTNPTGSTGPSRWPGSKKRSPRSVRCGTPAANSSARDSPIFPLHNALFDLPPYRGKWPEIWIAAHGPRMLKPPAATPGDHEQHDGGVMDIGSRRASTLPHAPLLDVVHTHMVAGKRPAARRRRG